MKKFLALSCIFILAACSTDTPPTESVPFTPTDPTPAEVMESIRNWCTENSEAENNSLCVCAQDVTKLPEDCDWDIDPLLIPKIS